MSKAAEDAGIWLRPYADYQRVWDHERYLRRQSAELTRNREYPLDLHVDKRWAPLGEPAPYDGTASEHIISLLDTRGPRFVLVLGDFGTGKTFLPRSLALRLAQAGDGLVPVLVTMRDLEKGRSLDELVVQHMNRHGEDPFHAGSFRYLLRDTNPNTPTMPAPSTPSTGSSATSTTWTAARPSSSSTSCRPSTCSWRSRCSWSW